MKCPICEAEIKNISESELRCARCGFDDIRTEFINDEERFFWQTYVVKPCKYAYKLNKTLQMDVMMLRKELKKLSSGGASSNATANSSVAPPQAKVTLLDGWNYDDPIAHPNSAKGTSSYNISFSISDIKSQMTSSSTATVTFLVKKESDTDGNMSANYFWIRYRVKDKDGVILLNETYQFKGLQVGDVTRGTIKLTGVAAGEHTIDFVSYN